MHVRYIPADPAGNLTGFVLTRVEPERRAALAARMMALCPEGFEQIGFVDEASLNTPLPRMEMMGGEFCGNATRAFALLAAARKGIWPVKDAREMVVRVSGASEPVRVVLEEKSAFAQMPLPLGVTEIDAGGRRIPVVQMEGISHAVLLRETPSEETARLVLSAMPPQDAQGVIFAQGERMTPFVRVAATGTGVWEGSCGSGSVALGWLLARGKADGEHSFEFEEPGGRLTVSVTMRSGRAVRAMMGGEVRLGEEREIEI